MKKLVLTLLILPLFASAAEAAGRIQAESLGDDAATGCLAGAALGAVFGAADSVAQHKPTMKLVTMPGLGCVAAGVAMGVGTGAMAAEAPAQDELQAEAPADNE